MKEPYSGHRLLLLLRQADDSGDSIDFIGVVQVVLRVVLHLPRGLLDHRAQVLLAENRLCDLANVHHSVPHKQLLEESPDALEIFFFGPSCFKLNLRMIE